jgi:hypothetical protein
MPFDRGSEEKAIPENEYNPAHKLGEEQNNENPSSIGKLYRSVISEEILIIIVGNT